MGSPKTCNRCLGVGTFYNPRTGMKRMENCLECRGTGYATPTPPAPADDARPMVTGGGLIKFDRRADDASGDDGMCIDGHPHRCGRCDRDIVESVPLPAPDDAVEEARRLREALLAQRKAWLDLPACGGTYCDEPDESGRLDCCQDATYHAAGEAIRAIDAALRRIK